MFDRQPAKSRMVPFDSGTPGPFYGPVRFEEQPAWVRKRGRKGKALSSRSARKSSRRGKSASSKRNREDYRKYLSARSTTFGPVPFELQPTWVRRRGRKGKALTARSGRAGRKSRRSSGETRKARKAANRAAFRAGSKRTARSGRKGRKAARRTNARDYVHFKATRAATFGPVQFKDQPTWIRKRGRKGKALSAKRRGRSSARGRSSRESKRAKRARNRAAFRAQKTRSKGRSRRSQKGSRSARRSARKSGGASVLTYNTLMKRLKGTKNKAWVCVGRKRTGCGGGKKGRRGSRVMGVLRP